MRKGLGVLISGNGSTLQALLDCQSSVDVRVVISSRPQAYGLLRAKRAGIPALCIPESLKGQKEKIEDWILDTLRKYRVEKLFLAGFMRVISENFIRNFRGEIYNIHPSLLPKYKGLNAFESAVAAGEKELGVTIHHVVPEVDGGETIVQRRYEAHPNKLLLHIQEGWLLRESIRKVLWNTQAT